MLNVSGNAIESLEGLGQLTRLRCLNINHNRVTRLNGLESLRHLQRLYVNHNAIQDIPYWIQKRLTSLQCIQIGYNRIENVSFCYPSKVDYLKTYITTRLLLAASSTYEAPSTSKFNGTLG